LKVLFLFRKAEIEFNSIETLFSGLMRILTNNVEVTSLNCPSSRANLSGIWSNILFCISLPKEIVHITGHINYCAIFCGNKTILTIHDIGSFKKNSWIKSLLFSFLWFQLPIYFSKNVTVISEFTKNEILRLYPWCISKLVVIPNSVNCEFIHQPFIFNEIVPTILLVGTKENKNLERVIIALEGLSCKLVILGRLSEIQISFLEKHYIRYINLNDLSLNEVVKVYSESDLLCFASVYEGFGLPILEAQATGRPVVTSNLGAMLEVAGESACLVDPFDIDSIRSGVERIILDNEYREQLIEKGFQNVKKYRLETIANQYYSLYEELEND
jgi:glycosyltransferase involved in cell wall biosynthesis